MLVTDGCYMVRSCKYLPPSYIKVRQHNELYHLVANSYTLIANSETLMKIGPVGLYFLILGYVLVQKVDHF